MKFHECPVHGWERCFFIENFGHGCTRGAVVAFQARVKVVENAS